MALRKNDIFAIIPIENSWFDFHLESDGKSITLRGKDKNKPYWFQVPGQETTFDDRVLIGCAYEQSRSDNIYNKILGEGVDDDGKRYLIIDRREKFKD